MDSRRGFALAIALMILALLSVLGAAAVESLSIETRISAHDRDARAALYLAEAALGEAEHAKLVWRPQTTAELDLEAAQSLMRLIDALEEDDDVQSVTANFEVSDEVMAQL